MYYIELTTLYGWIRYLSNGKAFTPEDKNITKAIKAVIKGSDDGDISLPLQVDYVLLPRVFFNDSFIVDVMQNNPEKPKKHSIQSLGDQFEGFSKKLDTILKHVQSRAISDSLEDELTDGEDTAETFDHYYLYLHNFIQQVPSLSVKDKKRMMPTMKRVKSLLSRAIKQSSLKKQSGNSKE